MIENEYIQVNINPNAGEILDPDMNLMCLHCGKNYKPYNHMVIHEFAFIGFCSVRCYYRYHSIPGHIWRAIKYPFWWVRSRFIIWNDNRYALPCPSCKELMLTMTKDIQGCDNTDCDAFLESYNVVSRKDEKLEKIG